MTTPQLALLAHQRADLRDRLNRAELVVGHHYADQNRVGSNRCPRIFKSHESIVVNRQTSHYPTALFQKIDCAAHRRMLDRGSDDVPAMRFGNLANSANC